jgi:proteasome component ECM29
LDIVNILIKYLSNTKDIRGKEQCALTLGMLPVGEEKFPFVQEILKGLFDTAHVKHLELHMTVGEAVSCAAGGRYCRAARDHWDVEHATPTAEPLPQRTLDNMKWTLQSLISKDYSVSPILSHRQSSGMWLVALLKFCGDIPIIKEHLKDFQMVFMNMLTDDDITQETASRGLGLIYDLADKDHRKDLVVLLSNTLLMGRKSDISLTPDTKLFPEGVLGKAPQGGKLTTYQELCSVASDMNKPDLIYKFLSLAHHHSMWNSKKGAAFGFQHIAQQAREELQPHLPVLVPKLYRYQYDPHSGIKQAMKSIWSSIVPDGRKAVDQYSKEIMADLQQNLNHHLWRNRESSCLALGDLLSVCQLEDVVPHLPVLWSMCLKVLDDIKESVREAAGVACKLLSKVTIRACDPNGPGASEAIKVLGDMFPVLLEQGMSSRVQESRVISLVTLLKITEDAGPLLKPHIPLFVPILLDAVSSLEPQVLNTYTLKLSGDEKIQEKLDSIRISASKSTPMMEAVNQCLPYIDSSVLEQLVPKLIDIIKTGVGMATKVNTSQFAVSLARQSPQDIAPHIGKILAALLSGLSDRSAGTRKAYASAIGQLVKYAKTSSVEKLNERLKTKLLEKTDESTWNNVGSAYYSMVMYSNDSLKAVMAQVVPVVFLAMHDRPKAEDEGESSYAETQHLWQNVWDELVTSTESAVRMYLAEIVSFVCQTLEETGSWHLKAQAATAIATLADKAGAQLGPPHLSTVCKVLLSGLSGRVWEGKQSLLKAARSVTITCKEKFTEEIKDESISIDKFITVLLKECKKKQVAYRVVAMDTLGCVLEEYGLDCFEEVYQVTHPCISPSKSEDSTDEEERPVGGRESAMRIELLVKCYMLLGRAWPAVPATQGKFFYPVFNLVKENLTGATWKIQLAMLVALTVIFKKFDCPLSDAEWKQTSSDVSAIVAPCVANVKYSTLRMKSLEVLDSYSGLLTARGLDPTDGNLLTPELKETLEGLKNPKEKELVQSIFHRISNH